jgi:fatty acid desaturase
MRRLLLAALVLVLAPVEWSVIPAVLLLLAAFTLTHDLAHGALGLPRKHNELALGLAGAVMLTSGHAMRVAHMRHHARPLGQDDLEGIAATVSWRRALGMAPWWALAVRLQAWHLAPGRHRRWQLVEHLFTLGLATALGLIGGNARVYMLVCLVLQLTAPVWAGRLPHTAPAWMVEVARRLAWTRSPVMLSMAFHDRHHARPKLATRYLGRP